MPCSFCRMVLLFWLGLCYNKSPFGPQRQGSVPENNIRKQGGFSMDAKLYIIAIVVAIILLAVNLIRDYGNRG